MYISDRPDKRRCRDGTDFAFLGKAYITRHFCLSLMSFVPTVVCMQKTVLWLHLHSSVTGICAKNCMANVGIEPKTFALLARRSNQLS
jgi:hypothetical protein